MICQHKQIRTWIFQDSKQPAGMWSCIDCGLKFEPINQCKSWIGLTDDERLNLWKETETDNRMVLIDAIESKLMEKNGITGEQK